MDNEQSALSHDRRFRYVLGRKGRMNIPVSRELHAAVAMYKVTRGIRTMAEAFAKLTAIGFVHDVTCLNRPRNKLDVMLERIGRKYMHSIRGKGT